jgi:aminoglycoside phosphotransferase (APT) family kinase protein
MPDHRSGALAADVSRLLDWYEWARRGRDFPVLDAALAEIRSGLAHDSGTRVLLWGDPRLGNMIVSEDLTVAALLDWEMAGIGQPELDVGWWLMMDEFAYRGLDGSVPQYLPSPGQIVATYESVTGRSLADLDFFQLVAAVKLAITLIPTSDSLTAKGTLEPGSRFATENVPTQMVARLLGMPEPDLCPDYRRFSRMDRASR